MDRFGRKRQIVPGALTLGSGIACMSVTAAFELSFVAFIIAFVWINLGVSMMAGTMQTLGADIAPANARGRFFGVNRLVAEAGSLTNPVSFSIVMALVAGAGGFALSFSLMASAGFLAAAMVGFGLKETLQRVSRDKPVKPAKKE